ncbi:hypothetical protein BJV74DRAFT_796414 [Russula compacta]|nr:hypothetical protein BJV74DRAFT_796414 [Russula compacta]
MSSTRAWRAVSGTSGVGEGGALAGSEGSSGHGRMCSHGWMLLARGQGVGPQALAEAEPRLNFYTSQTRSRRPRLRCRERARSRPSAEPSGPHQKPPTEGELAAVESAGTLGVEELRGSSCWDCEGPVANEDEGAGDVTAH